MMLLINPSCMQRNENFVGRVDYFPYQIYLEWMTLPIRRIDLKYEIIEYLD